MVDLILCSDGRFKTDSGFDSQFRNAGQPMVNFFTIGADMSYVATDATSATQSDNPNKGKG